MEITLLGTHDWKQWRNDGATEVGPFEVFRITGNEVIGDENVALGELPSTTFGRSYAVNGPMAVPASGYGVYQSGPEVLVAYDTGTPAVGDSYGPKPSQGTVVKNYPATCECLGIVDSTNKIMRARWHPIDHIIGKLAGSLSQGSTATVNVWAGAGGSEAVITSLTVTGRDWLMKTGATAIASGKKVVVEWIDGVPYVVEAECP